MTDRLDPTVRQILADIGKQGGATGVSFHQRPGAAARYPTEAILAAVRLLAEEAEAAKDPAMAAGRGPCWSRSTPIYRSRSNLPEPDRSLTSPKDRPNMATGGATPRHSDEQGENLLTALHVAAEVATEQARSSGKTYVMASATQPSPAIHVFACDHPDAGKADTRIIFEYLPDGRRIRREEGRRQ